MNIIRDEAENAVMRDLKLLKSKRKERRCIQFISKDLPEEVLLETLDVIKKRLGEQEVTFYICFETVFTVAEDIHFNLFLKIEEQVSKIIPIIPNLMQINKEKSLKIMSIFDLENDWSKIKRLIENVMIAKKQASKI